MGKSNMLSNQDVRSIYMLLGECIAYGKSPELWMKRIADELNHYLGAPITVIYDGNWEVVRGAARPGPNDHLLAFGVEDSKSISLMQDFFERGDAVKDPCAEPFAAHNGLVATMSRNQICRDYDWYNSEVYNEYYFNSYVNSTIFSRIPTLPGNGMLLNPWRYSDDPEFTDREVNYLNLLHKEIFHLVQQGKLKMLTSAPVGMTIRMRQVMDLLAEGLSEKQAALRLGISPHTCHDYVKQLHKYYDVNSRSELIIAILRKKLGEQSIAINNSSSSNKSA